MANGRPGMRATEFLIRSPLAYDECQERLAEAIEGPFDSFKMLAVDWHVIGDIDGDELNVTVAGRGVALSGKWVVSTRPWLSAHLIEDNASTFVTGEIIPRFPTPGLLRAGRFFFAPLAVVCAYLTVTNTVGPLVLLAIAVLLFCISFELTLVLFPRALRVPEKASQRYLLEWLELTIEGKAI